MILSILLYKLKDSVTGICFSALLFATVGVLSSYGLGEDEYAPLTKKEKVDQLDHVHNVGPLVTKRGRKRKEFIDD